MLLGGPSGYSVQTQIDALGIRKHPFDIKDTHFGIGFFEGPFNVASRILGDPGNGAKFRLCHQMLAGVIVSAVAEVAAVGYRCGLSTFDLSDVIGDYSPMGYVFPFLTFFWPRPHSFPFFFRCPLVKQAFKGKPYSFCFLPFSKTFSFF